MQHHRTIDEDTLRIMDYVDAIRATQDISREQLKAIISTPSPGATEYLHAQAREVAQGIYGRNIYMRGLIEITNHCKNDCYYCGIRRSNTSLTRYRLSTAAILACCRTGYACGMRTFVLQGGEDVYFTDAALVPLVECIRQQFPDCAITLSLGERSKESYRRLHDAGADRYLLRHETADAAHYAILHPAEMSWMHRMQCLQELREIGYQVGAGFMVGSPRQTLDTLYKDMQFIRIFRPEMCGIGPFVATRNTPFANSPSGTVAETLRLLSLLRLLCPSVLLPATTALGSLDPQGREKGILAGANVVMPNLSPPEDRKLYNIYDNKLSSGDDVAVYRDELSHRFAAIGYNLAVDRGDHKNKEE